MMTKNRLWITFVILLSCITMISLGSCSNDSDDPIIIPDTAEEEDWDVVYYELDPQLVDSTSIVAYDFYKGIYDIMQAFDADMANWAKLNMDKLYHVAESLAKTEGGNNNTIDVSAFLDRLRIKTTNIEYNSMAADGSKIRLSTLVAWPYIRGWSNPAPDHVALGCHGTIAADAARPTNFANLSNISDVTYLLGQWVNGDSFVELCQESRDMSVEAAVCLVVIPDYEGFGSTKNRSHPYLNREVQARQCIDAVRSGISWYKNNEKPLEEDWKLVSSGYSQGGAVSAATYRYYLEHKTDYSELNYAGAICGDGPYDLYVTMKFSCDVDAIATPCAHALMIKSLFDSDLEMIASGNELEDYLTEDFINTGIFEGIDSKSLSTDELDELVYDYIAKHKDCSLAYNPAYEGRIVRASTVFRPDVFEYLKNGTVPADSDRKKKIELLAHCFKKNSLFYKSETENWTPPSGAQFSFYHGKDDLLVPYHNFQLVAEAWNNNKKQCRFVTYDGVIESHFELGKLFFLDFMMPEAFLMFQERWASAELTTK